MARAWESKDWKNLSKPNQKALDNYREYLRIPSVHPNVDYEPCVQFLERLAKDIGLEFIVHRSIPKNPVVLLKWTGLDPTLPSIMLNSHMDVVPVFEEYWNHKPFSADIDDDGNVYARGTQDAKGYGIQYPEAIRRLKIEGFKPKRTVYVSYMPDEELRGFEGMLKFIKTDDFKKMNVGFALDEGRASTEDNVFAYYGEKRAWQFIVHCSGQPGHGSLLLDDTAGEKLQYILEKIYQFRKTQKDKNIDNVTTVNLTMISGGIQVNVIPSKLSMVFDVRSPVEEFESFETQIVKWCKEAGSNVEIETLVKDPIFENSKADESNPFWMALKDAVEKLDLVVYPKILPANSDARYLRGVGISAFGFSSSRFTPKRTHNHNEYLNINVFLNGISIYKEIIAGISYV